MLAWLRSPHGDVNCEQAGLRHLKCPPPWPRTRTLQTQPHAPWPFEIALGPSWQLIPPAAPPETPPAHCGQPQGPARLLQRPLRLGSAATSSFLGLREARQAMARRLAVLLLPLLAAAAARAAEVRACSCLGWKAGCADRSTSAAGRVAWRVTLLRPALHLYLATPPPCRPAALPRRRRPPAAARTLARA